MGLRIVALVLIAARIAAADPADEADAHFKKGSALYDLGKFEEAIVELEAAYTTDPIPKYLFAIAQAHRFAKHHEKAIALYRRYLDLKPDDPRRPDIEGVIAELERAKADKEAADKAAADKAIADKIAADKAEAERLAAEAAAKKARNENRHWRISVDVGLSLLRIKGRDEEPKSPSLVGRLGVGYLKRVRGFVLDFGGSWQITTIPYTRQTTEGDPPVVVDAGSASVFFTQLHGTAAASHTIAGPVWGRIGVGAGLSVFGNLKQGNPITDPTGETTMASTDIRMLCVRADWMLGYRVNPMIDFVLGIGAVSYSRHPSRREFDQATGVINTTTFESAQLGAFVKL